MAVTVRTIQTGVFRTGVLVALLFVVAAMVVRFMSAASGNGPRAAAWTLLAAAIVSIVVGAIVGTRRARLVNRLIGAVKEEPLALIAPEDLGGELGAVAAALDAARRRTTARVSTLERAAAEQDAIFQSMGTGLLALDRDHRVLSMNRAAAALLHVDAASARGRLVEEIVREAELNDFVREAIDSAEPVTREFRVGAGEHAAIVQASSEPLREGEDRPAGLLVTLTDVTTLRQLETLRSDFAANVSHELRTPITNIKGYVDTLIQVGVEDHEQTARFLEIIHRNAHRLASIIEDLLLLARLEQQGVRERVEMKSTAVAALVDEVIGQLESAAQAKQIRLQVEVPPDLAVCVVPSLAEQAIANLVSNAISYGPANSAVTITARPAGEDFAEIAVRDEGPGIPQQHQARIFERFYRVDKARSRTQGGTGLGLAIVKHIALALGGRVEVESRVGVGSVFRLYLPLGAICATSAPR